MFINIASLIPKLHQLPKSYNRHYTNIRCNKNQYYFTRILNALSFPTQSAHRYIFLSHLFEDTMEMISAVEPRVAKHIDGIVSVPYSKHPQELRDEWKNRFGSDVVHFENSISNMQQTMIEICEKSLELCAENNQKLILQDCDGFIPELFHSEPRLYKNIELVEGVVEVTAQGAWRANNLGDQLRFPVYHCSTSQIKKLEMTICGDTIARCVDNCYRVFGMSLAGRKAAVVGGGLVGASVAEALRRRNMIVSIYDTNPIKVMEARLRGFDSNTIVDLNNISDTSLLIGTTGKRSICSKLLSSLPDKAFVASCSSRDIEIDLSYFNNANKMDNQELLTHGIQAFSVQNEEIKISNNVSGHYAPRLSEEKVERELYLLNGGFPINFAPNSKSVPDEVIYPVLAELLVLLNKLATKNNCKQKKNETLAPGVYAIEEVEEMVCAEAWLEYRKS